MDGDSLDSFIIKYLLRLIKYEKEKPRGARIKARLSRYRWMYGGSVGRRNASLAHSPLEIAA